MSASLTVDFGPLFSGAMGQTATGSSLATALPLRRAINVISSVPSGSGVALPTSYSAGAQITVLNRDSTNALLVYPGASDQIEKLGIGMPTSIPAGATESFVSFDMALAPSPRTWWTDTSFNQVFGTLTATSITTGSLSVASAPTGGGIAPMFASPPPIGGTAAAAGTFTSLTATGSTNLPVPTLPSQTANEVFASPSGTSGVPSFRTITSADIATALQTPGPIGSTMPNTAEFTTLGVTGASTVGSGSANYLIFSGAASGSAPTISTAGSDPNPGLVFAPQGYGSAQFNLNSSFSGAPQPTFVVNGHISGTTTSGGNPYMYLFETTDTAQADASGAIIGTYIDHVLEAGFNGQRSALTAELTVLGAPSGPITGGFLAALQTTAQAFANVNGTSSAAQGVLIGSSFQATLNSGATWYSLAEGSELGVVVNSGASVEYINVLKVSSGSPVVGARSYNGLAISSSGPGPGFNIGLCFASDETIANPISTTGTMIGSQTASGSTLAAANGIDFSLWAFSGYFLKSNNFTVDGAGNVVCNGIGFLSQGETTGSNTGTLGNSPVVGNPSTWIEISLNGTLHYIPAWS